LCSKGPQNFRIVEKECAAKTETRRGTLQKGKLKEIEGKAECEDAATICPQIGTLQRFASVKRRREWEQKKICSSKETVGGSRGGDTITALWLVVEGGFQRRRMG
jgi:hypothetical protein